MAKKLIHFAGYKFLPNLNPYEMFLLGVHGGSFFKHCSPLFNQNYPLDKRGMEASKYDIELNYYGVYPAKLLKTSALTINHQQIADVTLSFMEWYYGFYNGERHPWDKDWIAVHTSLTQQCHINIANYLKTGDVKDAQKYGQLLIELAMNPGFEPIT